MAGYVIALMKLKVKNLIIFMKTLTSFKSVQ